MNNSMTESGVAASAFDSLMVTNTKLRQAAGDLKRAQQENHKALHALLFERFSIHKKLFSPLYKLEDRSIESEEDYFEPKKEYVLHAVWLEDDVLCFNFEIKPVYEFQEYGVVRFPTRYLQETGVAEIEKDAQAYRTKVEQEVATRLAAEEAAEQAQYLELKAKFERMKP